MFDPQIDVGTELLVGGFSMFQSYFNHFLSTKHEPLYFLDFRISIPSFGHFPPTPLDFFHSLVSFDAEIPASLRFEFPGWSFNTSRPKSDACAAACAATRGAWNAAPR
jgi:hypothetical protein